MIKYILAFVFFLLFQIAIVDKIQINGYVNPYVYIAFIMILPFETPRWFLLILSTLLGFTIDIFSNTLGMHMIACTLIGFLRPSILNLAHTKDNYEPGTKPTIKYYGIAWFFKYAILIILIHHTTLFYTEVFDLGVSPTFFLRTLVSALSSIVIILITQLLIFKK